MFGYKRRRRRRSSGKSMRMDIEGVFVFAMVLCERVRRVSVSVFYPFFIYKIFLNTPVLPSLAKQYV